MLLQEDGDVPQNIYKTVKIYTDKLSLSVKQANGGLGKGDPLEKSFKPCVSFNTVPSYLGTKDADEDLDFPGVQIPAEYTMEEFYDDESGFVSMNAEYFLRNQYVTNSSSFGGSPPPRNLSNKAASLNSMFRVAQNGKIVRVDYPTTPTIMNDAIVINRAQPGWGKLWYERKKQIEKRINDKQTCFRYPEIIFKRQQPPRSRISEDGYTPLTKNERRKERILNEKVGFPNTPRTILCHISGRRHTWVALDWTMRKLAQDTDHIVVLANIPRFSNSYSDRNNSYYRSQSRGSRRSSLAGDAKDPKTVEKDDDCTEWTSGYRADAISRKLEDLLDYIAVIVPKDITIRVTVEIVIGKTKKIMIDAMNVYTPEFCTSTTLRWERTDNMVLWKSRNLSDVLCTRYPVPVFVIPVNRMYDLEKEIQDEFPPVSSYSSYDSFGNSTSPTPAPAGQLKDSVSPVLEPSPILIEPSPSSESTSDFSDSDSETNSMKSFSKTDLILAAKKHREDISRSLREFEREEHDSKVAKLLKRLDLILKSSLDFSLQVQNMTQDNGEAGFEKLKRVITGGGGSASSSKRSMLDVADAPKQRQFKNVSGSRPRNSQIKFASDVISKDGSRALGNKVKPKSRDSSPPLRRSMSPPVQDPRRSYDEPLRKMKSSQSINSIRKVRSASNISRVKSNDSTTSDSSSSSSKKKSGFLSIFKSSGSRSRSTSRRNSVGSDNETINSADSDSKKRRSRLFGFS